MSARRASTITYNVDLTDGAASVTGFIETDGTIGTLAQVNVLDWNLDLDDGSSTWDLRLLDRIRKVIVLRSFLENDKFHRECRHALGLE